MEFLRTAFMFLSLVACLLALKTSTLAQHEHHQEHSEEASPQPNTNVEEPGDLKRQWLDSISGQQSTGPTFTLAELEQMAIEKNPTLAQGEAAIRAAQG